MSKLRLVLVKVKKGLQQRQVGHVNAGLEITIQIWVSGRKTSIRISISATISRFPARRPKLKVFHLPDNPWVSGRKRR